MDNSRLWINARKALSCRLPRFAENCIALQAVQGDRCTLPEGKGSHKAGKPRPSACRQDATVLALSTSLAMLAREERAARDSAPLRGERKRAQGLTSAAGSMRLPRFGGRFVGLLAKRW